MGNINRKILYIIIGITFTGGLFTAAYAGTNPAITLAGDVTVNEDLSVSGTISGIGTVPIGTVLDWWCSADCTIPDGFAIADGSVVSDPESPFNGETLPDLTDTFIRGVTNIGNVGSSGGASSHSHVVDPPNTGTSTIPHHSHDVDPPNTSTNNVPHRHQWVEIFLNGQVKTRDVSHNVVDMIDWSNGIGNEGEGLYLVGISAPTTPSSQFFTERSTVTYDVDIDAFVSSPSGLHSHQVNILSFNSDSSNNEPPWYGLVKIIRIK